MLVSRDKWELLVLHHLSCQSTIMHSGWISDHRSIRSGGFWSGIVLELRFERHLLSLLRDFSTTSNLRRKLRR